MKCKEEMEFNVPWEITQLMKNPDSYPGQKVYNHTPPDNDDSGAIWIPFIVVFSIHIFLMISDILCKFGFKRAIELVILSLLILISILELNK